MFAYAAAHQIGLRLDGSKIWVRRPAARRAFVSGKKKQNTIKFTKVSDERGRTLWDGTFRPGRLHDHTALQTDGIDALLAQYPDVQAEMDAGYQGLRRDHPAQVRTPPNKPAKDAPPDVTAAYEQARHAQSSQRICVEGLACGVVVPDDGGQGQDALQDPDDHAGGGVAAVLFQVELALEGGER